MRAISAWSLSASAAEAAAACLGLAGCAVASWSDSALLSLAGCALACAAVCTLACFSDLVGLAGCAAAAGGSNWVLGPFKGPVVGATRGAAGGTRSAIGDAAVGGGREAADEAPVGSA